MSQEENPNPFKTSKDTITEIVGGATTLVGYIMALNGKLPVPAPMTVSIAVGVLTSLFVISWRWREIKRQKENLSEKIQLILPVSSLHTNDSLLNSLIDHVKRTSHKNYYYSLTRRRIESSLLICIAIFSIIFVGTRFQAALGEFSPQELTCEPSKNEQPIRVIIADINEAEGSGPPLQTANRLYNFLSNHQEDGQFETCRLKQIISTNTEAKKIATGHKADMVIWGEKDVAYYAIHLEVPVLDRSDNTISRESPDKASTFGFQVTETAHLGYVTQFAMSEMLFLNGKVEQAQERLQKAITSAESEAEPNSIDIAQGYFELGFFYDPNTISDHPNPKKAIYAYSQAFDMNKSLYIAVLNRSVILWDQGQTQEALADYTMLIENNTRFKCSAYINRAELQTEPEAQDSDLDAAIATCTIGFQKASAYASRSIRRSERQAYQDAISDLQKAIELDPKYYYYSMLGLAQLRAGEVDAAYETYHQITFKLNEQTRTQVLDELEQTAQEEPNLKLSIDKISAKLKTAELSESTH